MNQTTLAVIIGNRDFFPVHLVAEARRDSETLCAEMGIETVMLPESAAKMGAVETWQHAKECAALFQAHRHRIDGILVVLPNFGDEKGIADTIKLSGLDVPILVQAYPDDLDAFQVERRRDAYCGKVSVCNNLRQYGYRFSLTEQHTIHPSDPSFREDLLRFAAVCRVVKGLRSARLGAVGARPASFRTMRYSEKLLQAQGITVHTVDLSEILAAAARLDDTDPRVRQMLQGITAYADSSCIPAASLAKMARLGVALNEWVAENDLQATAIQCWTSIQQNYGINPCVLMSMMSERLLPSACEVDVTGVASMYALQLASGKPSALVDWNNNYGSDADKCVLFHCGNWAKSYYAECRMAYAEILATTLGAENTQGTVAGRVPAGPLTFARISTDDQMGRISAYVGQGAFTDDPLHTFGSRAVVQVPHLQQLMRFICRNGFEHHVAMSASQSAAILAEAFATYFGWDVYHHGEESC